MSEAFLTVSMTSDTATPAVNALLARLRNPEPVLQRMADAGTRLLRDWFGRRPPNRSGYPSSGFWRRVAVQTAVASVTNTEAIIGIGHPGMAQRVYGGTITPKRGKFLALPASAAAYRAGSPREGGAPANLAFAYSKHPQGGWRPSLVVQEQVEKEVGKPRKDGTRRRKVVAQAGEIWYWLVRRATQAADPDALPPSTLFSDTVRLSALQYLSTATGARSQI